MTECAWHLCSAELSGRQTRFCSKRCKNKFFVQRRREALKEKAVQHKGGRCERCGYNRCLSALEFHRRDPREKEFKVGSGNTVAWSTILAELEKCDLLCSNCHREVHEGLR